METNGHGSSGMVEQPKPLDQGLQLLNMPFNRLQRKYYDVFASTMDELQLWNISFSRLQPKSSPGDRLFKGNLSIEIFFGDNRALEAKFLFDPGEGDVAYVVMTKNVEPRLSNTLLRVVRETLENYKGGGTSTDAIGSSEEAREVGGWAKALKGDESYHEDFIEKIELEQKITDVVNAKISSSQFVETIRNIVREEIQSSRREVGVSDTLESYANKEDLEAIADSSRRESLLGSSKSESYRWKADLFQYEEIRAVKFESDEDRREALVDSLRQEQTIEDDDTTLLRISFSALGS